MATPTAIVAYLPCSQRRRCVPVREFARWLAGAAAAAERGKTRSLRVRRADDRLELRAVRPAVLRGRPAVHHLRRRSRVLLSLGDRVRQSDAAGVARHARGQHDRSRESTLSPEATLRYQELGIRYRKCFACCRERRSSRSAAAGRQLALASLCDIGVFFAVLLVGFAYVWKRGDLDWVRAMRTNEDRGRRASAADDRVNRSCRRDARRGASVLSA